jgi:glucose PTS system EIICB or EIICBA component
VVHTLLTGVAFALTNYLGIVHSTDFAHGALQFFLYLNLPQTHNTWWFLIIGPLWALLYFFLFRFFILKFNLKTPGRESQPLQAVDIKEQDELALDLVEAMGGAANIEHLDACITRLRVTLHDIKLADIARIKALGAIDVLVVGNNLQAIFGTRSDNIKTEMSAALAV